MDINNLEPNSHKYRQEKAQGAKPVVEKQHIQKVISGTATLHRKSLGRRFIDIFFNGDVKDVKAYLIYDVLFPAIKETVSNLVTKGTEMILFGEASRSSSNKIKTGIGTYVSYGGQYRESRERLMPSRQNRMSHRFDDVKFETRGDAEQVLDVLVDYVERYGQATIGDFYDACGITPEWTDTAECESYGWKDMRGASVSRIRDGYIVDLPKCTKL